MKTWLCEELQNAIKLYNNIGKVRSSPALTRTTKSRNVNELHKACTHPTSARQYLFACVRTGTYNYIMMEKLYHDGKNHTKI